MPISNGTALLIVASTLCSAFYQLFSRRYGQTERPDASATMATIVGTVAALPFLPFEWVTPAFGWDLVLFVGIGVMAGIGHYFLTIAYSQAPAAVVAPFNYAQLIGAATPGLPRLRQLPRFLDLGRRGRDRLLRASISATRAAQVPGDASRAEQELTI